MKKTNFTLQKVLLILITVPFLIVSCNQDQKKEKDQKETDVSQLDKPFFKLSLAQWSLHKAINDDKTLDPIDFAEKASKMGFEGLEYVNHLYNPYLNKGEDPKIAMQNLLDTLKMKSKKFGMENLIIMIDGEGDLASDDDEEINKAVENHKKWVDAAAYLGCHSIRVNLFGSIEPESWVENSVNGLSKLAEYAKTKNINVIVENHGYLSSDANLLTEVIEKVDMDNCGTLPDFGNFCLKREGGKRWNAECVEEFDKYKGVEILMKNAKAVSAKSYDFDANGNETTIDYKRMLQIVKDSGYTGYIGVEYEGSNVSEEKGIELTKNLLLKAAAELSN